jgi:hypothetical protein
MPTFAKGIETLLPLCPQPSPPHHPSPPLLLLQLNPPVATAAPAPALP